MKIDEFEQQINKIILVKLKIKRIEEYDNDFEIFWGYDFADYHASDCKMSELDGEFVFGISKEKLNDLTSEAMNFIINNMVHAATRKFAYNNRISP